MHAHTRVTATIQDHPGKPVPEYSSSLDFFGVNDTEGGGGDN